VSDPVSKSASDGETVVAEQVVTTDGCSPLTVRISQHPTEDFWRVDVSRDTGQPAGHRTTTVASGEGYLMDLIRGAVDGEAVAWRHLAHWGSEALGASAYPAGRKRFA
jgi:hypothetical protein